jgi:hypothetical protein
MAQKKEGVVIFLGSQLVLDELFVVFPKICENALLDVHFIKIFSLKVEKKAVF